MLLDDGERIIMNSTAASILAVIVDFVAAAVFLWQSPLLAIVVALVSYPVWWLISNVVIVFCWVMTLALTAGVSGRYRLFVASRRDQIATGAARPVVLVITDDSDAATSCWMLLRPAERSDEGLLRAAPLNSACNSELPRAVDA
jgi:hypothetical protein